jgi:HEAT repeat protein
VSALLAVVLLVQGNETVRGLIEQLSADRIEAREDAFRRLEAIGRPALPLLEKAAQDRDGEVASRARTLLFRIPIREKLTPALIDGVKGIYDRLAEGQWRTVFLDLAADLRQPEERRRYPGVRAEDLSFIAPLAVQKAETDGDKLAVCEAVGRCRLKSALPDVARLLRDPQFTVRANAAAAIRDAGSAENARDLRPLLRDPHPVVRSVAAHAVARLGDKESIPVLRELLQDDSKNVRWWAIRALGDLSAREAAADIERLRDDADESVRRAAEENAAILRKKN